MMKSGILISALMLSVCLLAAGCTQGAMQDTSDNATPAVVQPEAVTPQRVLDTPDPSDLPAETPLSLDEVTAYGEDACFTVAPISDEVFARMDGKSYKKNCTIPRDELRYIRVLHKNFESDILTGELVMHESIADEICEIFHELYQADYPIERMRLVDDYDADDRASMVDNNTSGFNFRVVAGTNTLSNHARGLALDINPYYNPYCIPSTGYVSPPGASAYANRSADFPYKIEEEDLLYNLFIEHGFRWGGHWDNQKDYQHFEKNGVVIY